MNMFLKLKNKERGGVMPNYCFNQLKVVGKKKHLIQFDKDFKTPNTRVLSEQAYDNLRNLDFITQYVVSNQKFYEKYNKKFFKNNKRDFSILKSTFTPFGFIGYDNKNFMHIIKRIISTFGLLYNSNHISRCIQASPDTDTAILKLIDYVLGAFDNKRRFTKPNTIFIKKYSMKNVNPPTELELYRDNPALYSDNEFVSHWYDRDVKYQSVKWDVMDIYKNNMKESDEDDGMYEITYTFDTAWSVPVNFYYNISVKYPKLKFNVRYSEPGMLFAGEISYRKGKLKTDEHFDFSSYVDYLYYVNDGNMDDIEQEIMETDEHFIDCKEMI